MTRRTRNLTCIWVIILGLGNFVAYTAAYSCIGGDARNGYIDNGTYYVSGHHMHVESLDGRTTPVSAATWIYSYIHSISIWPTMAAIIVSTLILARPHIIATMREGPVSGQTLIAVFCTVIILIAGAMTVWFIAEFISKLRGA